MAVEISNSVDPKWVEALRTLAPIVEHLAERVGAEYTTRALISMLSQVIVRCSETGEVNRNLVKAGASLVRVGKAFDALPAADPTRAKKDFGTNG